MNELVLLDNDSELITPNYKEFIASGSIRRMSKIIRMGLACSKDCVGISGVENPEAIIVGTGLGCLADPDKFLNNVLTTKGLIPPTAFIQSTHNTIAGQVSLALKNHNYNVTHTQNSLSFEHALIDAILYLNDDKATILIGAVDETIPLLNKLAEQFSYHRIKEKLTSGASFFMIANEKTATSKAKLIDSHTVGLNTTDTKELVSEFLKRNNTSLANVDLVLYSSFGTVSEQEVERLFDGIEVVSIEKYSGYHLTTSAFGMHLAAEMLHQQSKKRILIYNTLNNSNVGLTLLESLEA